jgi:hypothetical protein
MFTYKLVFYLQEYGEDLLPSVLDALNEVKCF